MKLFILLMLVPYLCFAQDAGSGVNVPWDILGWVGASFALVKAISAFLNFVSKKTANKTDDKIALYLGKACGLFGKLFDAVIGNTRPK